MIICVSQCKSTLIWQGIWGDRRLPCIHVRREGGRKAGEHGQSRWFVAWKWIKQLQLINEKGQYGTTKTLSSEPKNPGSTSVQLARDRKMVDTWTTTHHHQYRSLSKMFLSMRTKWIGNCFSSCLVCREFSSPTIPLISPHPTWAPAPETKPRQSAEQTSSTSSASKAFKIKGYTWQYKHTHTQNSHKYTTMHTQQVLQMIHNTEWYLNCQHDILRHVLSHKHRIQIVTVEY